MGIEDTDESDSLESDGLPAYLGYEYQLNVTVWVALELLFNRGLPHIEIEPASQEDIEARLQVGADEASTVLGIETLSVQVKFRGSEWKPAAFRDLLHGKPKSKKGKPGPPPRQRAWESLKADPLRRYLLITNAQLAPKLQSLRVEELFAQPGHPVLPDECLDGGKGQELAERIAVMAEQPPELVAFKSKALLTRRLHVPTGNVEGCLRQLRESVRKRLLGEGSRQWLRGEILAEAQRFGGSLNPTPALDMFVPPKTFKQIEQQLASKHAVVLLGQAGAGKTLTAQHLEHKLRTPDGTVAGQPPFMVCRAKVPQDVRKDLSSPDAVLFVIEDPWGKSKLSSDADHWVSELGSFLLQAGAQKKFIITSRHSILEDAAGMEVVEDFCVRIDYEHYDEKARRKILVSMLRNAQPWQRQLAMASSAWIVEQLKAPISLREFAKQLKKAKSRDEVHLSDLIHDSGVDALATLVEKELGLLAWDAIPSAAVLWSLLCEAPTFSRAEMEHRERLAQQVAPAFAPYLEVSRLALWMAGERWLDSEDDVYRAHPTTIQGLEHFIKGARSGKARALLGPLLSGLVAAGQFADALGIAENLRDQQDWIPADVRGIIASSLHQQLLTVDETHFRDTFFKAVRWLNERDPVSLMVQALAAETKLATRSFLASHAWHRPIWTASEQAAVIASPEARRVAERHIRHVVPYHSRILARVLERPRWLSKLWDLASVYSDALVVAVEENSDGIRELAVGAVLSDQTLFDTLADKLLHGLDEVELEYQSSNSGTHGPDVADYYADRAHPYRSALEELVVERRRVEGHTWILKHPRRTQLLDGWGAALRRQEEGVTQEEMLAFFATCRLGEMSLLAQTIDTPQWAQIAPELVSALGELTEDELDEYFGAVARLTSPDQLKALIETHPPPLSSIQRAALVLSCQRVRGVSEEKARALQEMLTSVLLPGREALLSACMRAEIGDEIDVATIHPFSPEELKILKDWASEPTFKPGRGALVLLATVGEPALELMRIMLSHKELRAQLAAVRALAMHPKGDTRQLLRRALEDASFSYRERALFALAPTATPDERQDLLHLAMKESNDSMRLAYVETIRQHRWVEGIEVLIRFLGDEADWADDPSREEIEHRVARTAASALTLLQGDLSKTIISRLLEFARGGAASNADVVVHEQVYDLLMQLAVTELPSVLVHVAGTSKRPQRQLEQSAIQFKALVTLHNLVEKQPTEREKLLLPLVELAKQQDPWLSGVASITLGTLAPASWEASAPVFAGPAEEREAKAFLMLGAAASRGLDLSASPAAKVLPAAHPASSIVAWLSAPLPKSADEWRERLDAHPETRDWIWGLQGTTGWDDLLWRACCNLLGESFEQGINPPAH
ncbi:hypothetical protein [Myxococcus stipitatus]|uniref:nSTAND3 domain-containing NTPase n=1 Tax=Myxococcus stipitatus TaxID=83455 RepID=UPI0030CC4610